MLAVVLLYGALAACAILVAWLVVRYDLHEREPVPMLLLTAALGALAMNLAGRVQIWAIAASHGAGQLVSDSQLALLAGTTEELAKFTVVGLVAVAFRRHFNEPIDGLVYGSFAGLGAALEESVAVLTASSPPGLPMQEPVRLAGHLIMGGIGGFGVGLLVLRSRRTALGIVLCLATAMMLHTLWDVVAFAAADAHRLSRRLQPLHTLSSIGLMLSGMVIYRSLVTAGVRFTGAMLIARAEQDEARLQEPGSNR